MDKLDILNRAEFVQKLINLTENIAANKACVSFAMDGVWGCGKSFVLDMYEAQLSEIQSENKYFIVRYNCWKYDYYEEPLIALIAVIITAIEEKTKLFPDSEVKAKTLGVLKSIGVSLLSMANISIKEKTGVDVQKIFDTAKDGFETGKAAYESTHAYDAYFGFNKIMAKLNQQLREISSRYTVVFLVDELDRCLPEYAIKILERLHHLTENVVNTITLISIDKHQLEATIEQIFGSGRQSDQYLKKFIQFEITLDKGIVSEKFVEKYAEYINLFDSSKISFHDSIEEFMQEIFKDIDARTQERLIQKAALAHKILFSDTKDYSFMCIELLIIIMTSCYQGLRKFSKWFDPFYNVYETGKPSPPFGSFMADKFGEISNRQIINIGDVSRPIYAFTSTDSLYSAIAYLWYELRLKANNGKAKISIENRTIREILDNNAKELHAFINMIEFIK